MLDTGLGMDHLDYVPIAMSHNKWMGVHGPGIRFIQSEKKKVHQTSGYYIVIAPPL